MKKIMDMVGREAARGGGWEIVVKNRVFLIGNFGSILIAHKQNRSGMKGRVYIQTGGFI